MSRMSRNSLSSNFFHIMVQGINKEYIFEEDLFKKMYLKFLFENSNTYNITIIAYCVMDNHIHILAYVNKIENMSNLMKCVNEKFAFLYNKIKNRVGYLFRNRYKSEPILNEKYLYHCILYIHKNPIKAGITQKLDEYRFASTMQYSINKVRKILNCSLLKYVDKEDEAKFKFIDINEVIPDEDIEKIMDNIISRKMQELKLEKIDKRDRYIMRSIINEIREKTNASMEKISAKLQISKSSVSRFIKSK